MGTLKGKGKALREKPLFWKTVAPWPARKAKPDHWVSYAVVSQNWKLVANRDAFHRHEAMLKIRNAVSVDRMVKTTGKWQRLKMTGGDGELVLPLEEGSGELLRVQRKFSQ